MTANQIVAYNLNLARTAKGWTQEDAAERLAPYLGERWSKATFSAAERSVSGKRVRAFDADDLVAFARVFELPVSWFLMPPLDDPWNRLPAIEPPPAHDAPTVDPDTLVVAVLGNDTALGDRLEASWEQLSDAVRTTFRRRRDGAAPNEKSPKQKKKGKK
jgi:transcriptional regulator with XRE-family HTH domain